MNLSWIGYGNFIATHLYKYVLGQLIWLPSVNSKLVVIPNTELNEVNRKLSLLIGMNVATIIFLVVGLTVIILYSYAWVIALVIIVGVIHLSVTIYLHIKLKKHTHLR